MFAIHGPEPQKEDSLIFYGTNITVGDLKKNRKVGGCEAYQLMDIEQEENNDDEKSV